MYEEMQTFKDLHIERKLKFNVAPNHGESLTKLLEKR